MLRDKFGIQRHENGRRNTSPFLPRFSKKESDVMLLLRWSFIPKRENLKLNRLK